MDFGLGYRNRLSWVDTWRYVKNLTPLRASALALLKRDQP